MLASAFEEHRVRLKLVSVVGKEVIELIHEEIDKEISGKSVNIAVRMLKPELDQFMKGLNKAVQAPAKTAGKAVVNKIHPTSGRQSIKTLIKQGQGVSSIPLADEGLRDFQKIAKKYGVDFAVVIDREKSPPVYTVFFKAKDTDAVTRILLDYSAKQIKKPSLEAKRRMMDLDNLIKGLYENFTLGRLPERQFNRLMTEYDTEQSSLEQRISELETATERISTKAVQIDKFVRLVKKYRDFEELTTPMLNDFIEKVVIHEAEGGRTKDRTQQVDIYFNFIGNFVLPLSEDEVEALQSEEARRAEEIAERKRKSSKKSTQKRNHKRAEIKAKAEAGDSEAMAEYKAILEKGRQNNRKRAEKMRELRMSDPEYRAKMEEKERLALEREKKRQERATKKKKIALAE